MNTQIDYLKNLFYRWSGKQPLNVVPLPPSGSERRYFRLTSDNITAIGAWHPVWEETRAFLYLSRHFRSFGLHVPEILGQDDIHQVYLLEDLGDTSLLSLVEKSSSLEPFPAGLNQLYRKALAELVHFQVIASDSLDYSLCYPRSSFDRQSMHWDLQYFKYYFLKLHTAFHEEKLEKDFKTLIRFLSQADFSHFMYRDFQARNILIKDDQPYFIDYQGGRKGPLQYDAASLLFQVKAKLPADTRNELLDFYLSELVNEIEIDHRLFRKHYDGFVLIRLLQVLGAYGFRGLIERKPHFLASIPYALESLSWWLKNVRLDLVMPELMRVLEMISGLDQYKDASISVSPGTLNVMINSFSYKQGIPADRMGHGEGFVFDCRALPNPGREEYYRSYDGRDPVVAGYLEKLPEVGRFLEEVTRMIGNSVDNYLDRKFSHLTVNFGCTGGQHRSVYCAERLAAFLRQKYPDVNVILNHTMLNS